MTARLIGSKRITFLVAILTATGLAGFGAVSAHAGNGNADASPVTEHVVDPKQADTAGVVETKGNNGSGCRAGTADVRLLPNRTGFTVTYHAEYLARVGPGAKPIDFRKNCQVNLQVSVPRGQTFAISRADHRGLATLRRGAVGTQRWTYYFAGTSSAPWSEHNFTGPYNRGWAATDTLSGGRQVWHPCGTQRTLNVNTELRVRASASEPRAANNIRINAADNTVDATYRFVWKRC